MAASQGIPKDPQVRPPKRSASDVASQIQRPASNAGGNPRGGPPRGGRGGRGAPNPRGHASVISGAPTKPDRISAAPPTSLPPTPGAKTPSSPTVPVQSQPVGCKFCTECGVTRVPGSKFCGECGYRF